MSGASWGFFSALELGKPSLGWATCYTFVSFESQIQLDSCRGWGVADVSHAPVPLKQHLARRLTLSPVLSDGSRHSTQERACPSGLNLWHPLPFLVRPALPPPHLCSAAPSPPGECCLCLSLRRRCFLSPSPGGLEPCLPPCYCQGHGMPRKGIIANPNKMSPPSAGTQSSDPPVSWPGTQQGLPGGCHASSSAQRLKVGLGKTTSGPWSSSCGVHVDHILNKGPVQMRPFRHPGPDVTTRGTLVARRSDPAPDSHLCSTPSFTDPRNKGTDRATALRNHGQWGRRCGLQPMEVPLRPQQK